MTTTPYPEALAQAFSGHSDGAHWGISDWYEDIEQALLETLTTGVDFDTGWYGSKKEIWSGRVSRNGDAITCSGSVSDDFDTSGLGQSLLTAGESEAPDALMGRIREALNAAIDAAEQDRKDNEDYRGWNVGKVDPETGSGTSWWGTYIQPIRDGCLMDSPPGDNYYCWGWQDIDPDCETSDDDLPQHIREAFEDFIIEMRGDRLVVEDWCCEAWDAPKPDPIDAALTENRESPAGGPTP